MELEDVGIVFNVKYLPETVMSDAEYKAKRDAAVESMLRDRLALKGVLAFDWHINEHEFAGVPTHQAHSIMIEQSKRMAEREFGFAMSGHCMQCPHKHTEVHLDHDMATRGITAKARCRCEAKLKGGMTCFDGYMPASNSWLWPDHATRAAEFIVDKPNAKGLVFAKLEFHVDINPLTLFDPNEPPFARMPNPYGDVRDEPPGQMTRMNADGAYLTSEEIKMADRALKVLAKQYQHMTLSPKPQTPTEDAW